MDVETMSKRINGGTIGMADRIAKINKVLDVLT
jgi:predicted chitinase